MADSSDFLHAGARGMTVRADSSPALSDRDFARFSRLVHEQCGIRLGPHKKTMLEGRLRKRLRALQADSFEDYVDFVFSQAGLRDELVHLIDVVTTNKTDFFREAAHFDFMMKNTLPELVETFGIGLTRKLRVWSAACSTGEEPYTLAMVLSEFSGEVPGFDFSILATDISTRVLETARLGIYREEKVMPVPFEFKKKYLLRSKDPEKKQVRVIPELRRRVTFRRLNLMTDEFHINEPVDIIFCRNVIIYFDQPTQKRLLTRLTDHLAAGRFLFMGHSETLHSMQLPLTQLAPSVYRKI
jgi:chemotaxis protein methyltransferase CheR